ncbi:MAG TPA: hypothetical protein VEZ42_17185 [Pseudonocardia sp.]|nr:hypothetical protein [Pseudonocardia sp.]
MAQLVQVWLRAEQARDLVVLRAHHITGPALRWLVSLAGQEGLRVWLISPLPLPQIVDVVADLAANPARPATISGAGVGNDEDTHDDTVDAVIDVAVSSAAALGKGPAGGRGCTGEGCEDLNLPAAGAADAANDGIEDVRAGNPCAVLDAAVDTSLSVATARRLRRLYDIEAAALAATAVLQGRPDPETFAAATPRVAPDAATMVTAQWVVRAVPEHARALLRGWAGRRLVPREWALDVATAYLTLRLEVAQRDSGIALLDPALPLLPPVAWHNRYAPEQPSCVRVARRGADRLGLRPCAPLSFWCRDHSHRVTQSTLIFVSPHTSRQGSGAFLAMRVLIRRNSTRLEQDMGLRPQKT